MAEVRYKKIKLGDIMDNQGGNSKYSLKYINANPGEYPVYSAKTTGDMNKGYINTYDYDMECLQITSDGAKAGTIIHREKTKFSIGPATRIWYIKECIENLSLKYIEIKLRSVFSSKDFSWTKKASLYRIKNIEFEIPIDCDGNYDLETQIEIVKKYEIVEEKKKEIKEKLDYFKDVQVDFSNEIEVKTKEIPFDELFDIERGKVISRKYIDDNKGDYPVYSTQLDSSFGYINSYMYDGEYLIWNTDGLGGYIRRVDGKFSITNIVGIMKLKNEYKNYVNLEYIRRILEPIFRENVKGREGIGGKNEYTKINSTMIKDLDIKINFPINEDGTFNIEKQKQIVSKYKVIEEMKNSILEKGLPFTLSNVQFDGKTPYIYIYIRVRDLFDIQRGKSTYTKTYCKNNKGDYPVYSADNNSPLGYRNAYDYDGKFLTSSINGIAGILNIINGKFSTNADRVVFIPKVENINLEYVKNILEPILRNKNKGRKGLKGKNEFTKLTPSMIEDEMIPIPYDVYGEIFSEKQSIIAANYKTIDMIKKEIENRLSELINIDLFF
ncbi:MAG: restriction endonuclease subunit S [Ezakiella sp.]|nr:restriction endonuclease subunit S [Ezakiella sp.]